MADNSTDNCPQVLVKFMYNFRNYYVPVGTILCIISIISSILNATILSRRSMRNATNTILTGIALADLCTASINLPYILARSHDPPCPRNTYLSLVPTFLRIFASRFLLTSHSVSVWFGVLLAIFRFAIVCLRGNGGLPGSKSALFGIRGARIAMIVTVPSVAFFLTPYYVAYTIGFGSNSTINCSGTFPSQLYMWWTPKYFYWGLALIFKALPCMLMTGFSCCLVRMLHVASRKRISVQSCALNSNNQRSSRLNDRLAAYNRTTTMLLCIITLINCIELPQGILMFIRNYSPMATCIYISIGDLLDFSALVKNAAIFTLYCSMSSDFRREFRLWLRCSNGRLSMEVETSWTKVDGHRHRLANANNSAKGDVEMGPTNSKKRKLQRPPDFQPEQ